MTLPYFMATPKPEMYLKDNYVVLDFEIDTSYGDYGHPVHKENQMLLACWICGPGHRNSGKRGTKWGGEYEMQELIDDLVYSDLIVAHNAKYEMGWLQRCGFDIGRKLVFDTKIAEYVLSGNVPVDTSLNACCIRRGIKQKDPIVDLCMKRGVNPIEIPRTWLEGRCRKDVRDTETLYRDQRTALDRTARLGVLYTRCIFTPVLADIEQQGMMLDKQRVMQLWTERQAEVRKLTEELSEMAGGINFNSDKQLAEFLYETLGFEELTDKKGKPIRTDGGKPKTDSATLAKLVAKTPEQKKFVDTYRQYNKLESSLSKYLNFYRGVCEQYGGVFYAEFNQTVTATHRLSSSGKKVHIEREGKELGTQFQNQPREFKSLFKAKREGWLFCEWDGSGLEFRVAGIAGNDEQIKKDLTDPDFDPHTQTASVIFKKDYKTLLEAVRSGDKEAKALRTAAKAFTFKPLYGGRSGTPDQVRYYDAFNQRYHALVKTQESWLRQAMLDKVVVLPWGMRYYFPKIKVERDGYVADRTNIFNYPIQGLATAEILPIAATAFWHYARQRARGYIITVNTVHDSVLAEVHPDYVEVYKQCTIDAWKYVYFYLQTVYNMNIDIPLGTEFTVGSHWSEGGSESFNVFYDNVEKG